MIELAERLLEKEVIFKEDLEKIFGKRPFESEFDQKGQEKINEEGQENINDEELTPEESAQDKK